MVIQLLVSKGMTPAEELADPFHPSGTGSYRTCVQFCECGFHQNRYQYGCCEADGRDCPGNSDRHTADQDSLGCAKLVVFCNAPDDNPFMAGAFHGVTEADCIINVGVSGPGVVKTALETGQRQRISRLSVK